MEIEIAPLLDEPITVKDRKGNVYTANPELTGADALYFITRGKDSGSAEYIERMADTLSECLLPFHPEMTPAEVLRHFPLFAMVQIVARFLVLTGHSQYFGQATTPTPTKKPKPKPKPA